MSKINLTTASDSLLRELAEDADNWNGQPLINGNVTVDKAREGNLTDLKVKGLLVTDEDEGLTWVTFTEAGIAYAKENYGIDI